MPINFNDLTQIPEFRELLDLVAQQGQEIKDLRDQLPDWVDQVEAERLTGLSATTLWRERHNPRSLIEWKSDRGVRYKRATLLAHMISRTIVRRRSV